MKKFFTLLVLAACCAAMTWGCSDDKYDDTEIRQEIENLKQEIASMKEQVNSLKTIIDALNENKFITNYTEAADGSCTITFNDGKTITLHNGKDGAAAPAIGIAQFEGIYYWTLGGDDQWLLDDNQNKIPVAGQNGKTPTINKCSTAKPEPNPNDETPIDNRTVPHNAHRACTGGENQKKRVVERQSFVCRSHPRSQCHGTAADEGDRHPENPARHYDIA